MQSNSFIITPSLAEVQASIKVKPSIISIRLSTPRIYYKKEKPKKDSIMTKDIPTRNKS